MTLVFDTSALSSIMDNDENIINAAADQVFTIRLVPLATDAELRFGFRNGTMEQKNLALYEDIKLDNDAEIMLPDQETAIIYAELAAWCAKNGKSLSNNDLWIAATCVQHGARLLTTGNDFAALPQVRLANL